MENKVEEIYFFIKITYLKKGLYYEENIFYGVN